MAEPGAFETIVAEIGKLLLPLQRAIDSPAAFQGLLLKLGWNADVIPKPIADLAVDLAASFRPSCRTLVGGGLSFDGNVAFDGEAAPPDRLAQRCRSKRSRRSGASSTRSTISSPRRPRRSRPRSIADNFKGEFPGQLVSYLFITYLRDHHPGIGFASAGARRRSAITLSSRRPATGPAYVDYTLNFSDIPKIFSDPETLLENAFDWGKDDFDFAAFARQIDNLADGLDATSALEEVPEHIAALLEDGASFRASRPQANCASSSSSAPQCLAGSPPSSACSRCRRSGPKKPGLALMPSFNGLVADAHATSARHRGRRSRATSMLTAASG